jgi:hypothetical protein
MWFPIKSKYSKNAQEANLSPLDSYKKRALNIEQQLTSLLIDMSRAKTPEKAEERDAMERSSIALRHTLNKLQTALRFLR